MAGALSLDLRERVIAAIEAGVSCRQAAERFGVAAASAIRWDAGFRAEGEIAAKPMGGDRHSHRVEAHAGLILKAYEAQPQIYSQDSMRWVIVSVGMFTSFLFEPSFGVIELDQGAVRALGGWDNAVTVTTPQDIGRLTAEIVFVEPEFVNEVVRLAGDTITYGRLADVVERTLRRPITREVLKISDLMIDLSHAPDDTMRRYRAVFAIGRGMWWDKDKTFNARRGTPVTDAESWLRAHLARRAEEAR